MTDQKRQDWKPLFRTQWMVHAWYLLTRQRTPYQPTQDPCDDCAGKIWYSLSCKDSLGFIQGAAPCRLQVGWRCRSFSQRKWDDSRVGRRQWSISKPLKSYGAWVSARVRALILGGLKSKGRQVNIQSCRMPIWKEAYQTLFMAFFFFLGDTRRF